MKDFIAFAQQVRTLLYTHYLDKNIDLTLDELDRLVIDIDISNGYPIYVITEDYLNRLPDAVVQEIDDVWNAD